MQKINLILVLASLGIICNVEAAIFYVDVNAADGNDGSSWSLAFNNLDSALIAVAAAGHLEHHQIWVSQGTYKPSIPYGGGYDGSEPNLATFNLPSNVSIYGGFSGNESTLTQRNSTLYPTILSGDLNGDDDNISGNFGNKSDNAWHVLTADGVWDVVLDGLVVQDGYAGGSDSGTITPKILMGSKITALNYAHDAGGGLIARHGAKVLLNNILFQYNAADSTNAKMFALGPVGPTTAGGGAIAAIDPGTLVTLRYCTFKNNAALGLGCNGGAISALMDATLAIYDTVFLDNQTNRIGGALHLKDCGATTVEKCEFIRNKTTGETIKDESGGAIGCSDTNLLVSECMFEANQAISGFGSGGAIFQHILADDGEGYILKIKNSIFTDNVASGIGGGGVTVFGIKVNPQSSVLISNSLFNNNIAGVGGAVYLDSVPGVIKKCTFTGNNAWVEGGAVFGSNFANSIFDITSLSERPELRISDSIFIGNSIIDTPFSGIIMPVDAFNFFGTVVTDRFKIPAAGVTAMNPGGGAIASEFGGNIHISSSKFIHNHALNGNGGALLVGGTLGFAGTSPLAMNQAMLSIENSECRDNTDQTGLNNVAILDPANLGDDSDGVKFVGDGSL